MIAALTLAGLPTDRFAFFGFLPAKAGARAAAIAEAAAFRGTLAFYESGPRLAATLAALRDGLGDREAAVAREISKRFEETRHRHARPSSPRAMPTRRPRARSSSSSARPARPRRPARRRWTRRCARRWPRLSPSRAAAEVAARLGLPKRQVYERAQQLK